MSTSIHHPPRADKPPELTQKTGGGGGGIVSSDGPPQVELNAYSPHPASTAFGAPAGAVASRAQEATPEAPAAE